MDNDSRFLKLLTKLAKAVPHVKHARHAACLVRKNKIISFGINSKTSHPLAKKYGSNEHRIYLHAEVAAIKNALPRNGKADLKDCTLYVVRMKHPEQSPREWVIGDSSPCSGCLRAISDYGIGRTVYTV